MIASLYPASDPVAAILASYNAKRQSRGLRSIDGSPLINLDSNIDQVGGPLSAAAAPGGGSGGGITPASLQAQIDHINNVRFAGMSGALSATCSGGGVTGTITITVPP